MAREQRTPWWLAALGAAALCVVVSGCRDRPAALPKTQTFPVKGLVREVKSSEREMIIDHETIPHYMEAMTMPFHVKATNELARVRPGDQITFRLHVTEDESWIDQIAVTGHIPIDPPPPPPPADTQPKLRPRHPLLDYPFTNELGQAVSFNQFTGRALAYTFFFTRCPIPDYCPRLSKNFEEASAKLRERPDAPTNWHFLSVTIDPDFDTPAVLRAYGQRYHYDTNHWSFLTGPKEKIRELASLSGMHYETNTSVFFNHNFRTLVIDPAGRLHMSFPIGGNLSDMIVAEILKATGSTNQ